MIGLQDLASDNKLYIEGYAIETGRVEKFLQQQKEESSAQAAESPPEDSQSSASGGYSMKKVVFKSNRDGNDNIYSINLDGSDWQRLTDHNGGDLYPEVSPDGKKIAYTSDISGVWQIMDWNGQNKRQITHNGFRSAYPSWSHDMKYIYFEAYLDGDWDGHPMFSPDDKLIVYEEKSGGKYDIILFDIGTGGKTNITNTRYNNIDACFMYQK